MYKLTVTSKHRSGVLQPQEVRLCQVYQKSRSFCNGRGGFFVSLVPCGNGAEKGRPQVALLLPGIPRRTLLHICRIMQLGGYAANMRPNYLLVLMRSNSV
jgi:hypothetical protein